MGGARSCHGDSNVQWLHNREKFFGVHAGSETFTTVNGELFPYTIFRSHQCIHDPGTLTGDCWKAFWEMYGVINWSRQSEQSNCFIIAQLQRLQQCNEKRLNGHVWLKRQSVSIIMWLMQWWRSWTVEDRDVSWRSLQSHINTPPYSIHIPNPTSLKYNFLY